MGQPQPFGPATRARSCLLILVALLGAADVAELMVTDPGLMAASPTRALGSPSSWRRRVSQYGGSGTPAGASSGAGWPRAACSWWAYTWPPTPGALAPPRSPCWRLSA
ncbi:MAG: hypothetical protein M0T72_05040 [Candidatus Dormibacteraeota bacterium]|nr:hypothetical protein [Candidatus Dormibacteraeota bacterium]